MEMEENKHIDDLTGFFLRKSLDHYLSDLIEELGKENKKFSIILLDLDHFKKYNDKFGHPFGDEILKYTSSMMRLSSEGSSREFFRYGGDEFITVLSGKNPREATAIANQFKYNMLRRPFMFKGKFFKVTASSGISTFPDDGDSPSQIVKKADEAMYFSKRHGRNIITQAGMIKYLHMRNTFLISMIVLAVSVQLFLAYEYYFKYPIRKTLEKMSALRITVSPVNTDIIVLKDGTGYTGRILKETNQNVIFCIYAEDGKLISMNFKKSEIAKIEYGTRTISHERYRDYIEEHPNPHTD